MMSFTYLLCASAILTSALTVAAYLRRDAPGGRTAALLMLIATLWTGVYTLEWLGVPQPEPLFWLKIVYTASSFVSPILLIFVAQHAGHGAWMQRRIPWLLTPPVIFCAFLWTDPLHQLWFAGQHPYDQHVFSGGPAYWAHLGYAYAVVLFTFGLLISNLLTAPRLYRGQALAIAVGALIPVFTNVATLVGVTPLPDIDATPIGFAIAALTMIYALYRGGLLEIVPMARHSVVEGMEDGVVVIDPLGRVLDINPAARAMLHLAPRFRLGQKLEDAFPNPVEREALGSFIDAPYCRELIIHNEQHDRHIDVTLTPLLDRHGNTVGRLAVLHDISRLKAVEHALREQLAANKTLQAELHEKTIRDPLTGLFNRRYLDATLSREAILAAREDKPLTLVLIDLDHFKQINDTHGHAAGDRLLVALAKMLGRSTRGGDAACRYGGEEFVVLMPGATPDDAAQRVEQWRRVFAALTVHVGDSSMHTTFSAGIASAPTHARSPAELFAAADKALYRAKTGGRNRVCVAEAVTPGAEGCLTA